MQGGGGVPYVEKRRELLWSEVLVHKFVELISPLYRRAYYVLIQDLILQEHAHLLYK
jgi:hypothetical protein